MPWERVPELQTFVPGSALPGWGISEGKCIDFMKSIRCGNNDQCFPREKGTQPLCSFQRGFNCCES